jgi:hypothetical protein
MANIRILGAIVAGFALCGCASTAGNVTSKSLAKSDPTCLADTGSRAPGLKGDCRGTGRSYTQFDLQRTGETDVGDALAHLDPSITVHH